MITTAIAIATFAGGCFWCMQPPYDHIPGVIKTTVGYTGGSTPIPTDDSLSTGSTGHYEAVQIEYDPKRVRYEDLITVFWKNVDPTQSEGQFADIGPQYRTAIFYHDELQHQAALKSKADLQASGKFNKPITVQILPASRFYPAEDYHQRYYQKNTQHYNLYKEGSGRKRFIEKNWDSKESF